MSLCMLDCSEEEMDDGGGGWGGVEAPPKPQKSRIIFLYAPPTHTLSISLQELQWRLYRSAGASTTLCKTLTGLFNIPSSIATALLTLHISDNR